MLILLYTVHCTSSTTLYYTYTGYTHYTAMSPHDRSSEFCVSLIYCLRNFNDTARIKELQYPINHLKKYRNLNYKYIVYESKINFIISEIVCKAVLNIVKPNNKNVNNQIIDFFNKITGGDRPKYMYTHGLAQKLEKTGNIDDLGEFYLSIGYMVIRIIESKANKLGLDCAMIYELYCEHTNSFTANKLDGLTFTLNVKRLDQNEYLNFLDKNCLGSTNTFILSINLVIQRYIVNIFADIKTHFKPLVLLKTENERFTQCAQIMLYAITKFRNNINWLENSSWKGNIYTYCMVNDIKPFEIYFRTTSTRNLLVDSVYFHLSDYVGIKETGGLSTITFCDYLITDITHFFTLDKRNDAMGVFLEKLRNNGCSKPKFSCIRILTNKYYF